VVLEKMLGRSLEELMQEKVFKPLGMNMSSYPGRKNLKRIMFSVIRQMVSYTRKTKTMTQGCQYTGNYIG